MDHRHQGVETHVGKAVTQSPTVGGCRDGTAGGDTHCLEGSLVGGGATPTNTAHQAVSITAFTSTDQPISN